MSMNLNARDKHGNEVTLWQTPTWVSYCAWLDRKDKPRHWKDTRHLYLEWVKSHTQGLFKENEHEEIEERVNKHINYIMKAGKLKWFVM